MDFSLLFASHSDKHFKCMDFSFKLVIFSSMALSLVVCLAFNLKSEFASLAYRPSERRKKRRRVPFHYCVSQSRVLNLIKRESKEQTLMLSIRKTRFIFLLFFYYTSSASSFIFAKKFIISNGSFSLILPHAPDNELQADTSLWRVKISIPPELPAGNRNTKLIFILFYY